VEVTAVGADGMERHESKVTGSVIRDPRGAGSQLTREWSHHIRNARIPDFRRVQSGRQTIGSQMNGDGHSVGYVVICWKFNERRLRNACRGCRLSWERSVLVDEWN
jgi:hypothetical protein